MFVGHLMFMGKFEQTEGAIGVGVGKRGANTGRCSRAAAAVWRGFAAQITKKWLQKKPHSAGV
jgi:hypothetical protein